MVEDAARSIGQALAAIVAKDLWLNDEEELEIHLKFQYRAYSKQDPPPKRVKPVPVQVLRHIDSIAAASTNKDLKSISAMIQIA